MFSARRHNIYMDKKLQCPMRVSVIPDCCTEDCAWWCGDKDGACAVMILGVSLWNIMNPQPEEKKPTRTANDLLKLKGK